MTPLLMAKDLHKSYFMGKTEVSVLRGVNLDIQPGAVVAIMGASGAGKTTLLHVLGGLDRPTGGTVHFQEHDLYALSNRRRTRMRATSIGFVFQAYHLLPELDVFENVLLPAMTGVSGPGWQAKAAKRAGMLLEKVGLGERLRHRPTELSGGEQQRAAIARALMNDPELIFADEPTGNLDSETGHQVLGTLFSLAREHRKTLVVVTHDKEVAANCDYMLHLSDGLILSE